MRYETLMQRLCPADMYDFNRGGVARSLCNTVLYKELRTSPTPRLLPSETPPPNSALDGTPILSKYSINK